MEKTTWISLTKGERAGSQTRSGVWFIALGAALWGIDPLFRILLLNYFTSAQIVLIEHLLLLIFAVPVLWFHRAELRGLTPSTVAALLFISWGGSAIATILFTNAFAQGNPNAVLLLQKLQPLFAIIAARLILKETLPGRFLPLLALALAGTYLLTFGWSAPIGHWGDFADTGALLSIGAAALWGGSTVMGRLLVDRMRFETVTALRFTLALPLLIAATWSEGSPWQLPHLSMEWAGVSLSLLLQAFLPGLFSLLLYYRGLSNTKASVATLAELSFPTIGVLLNWLVFHQSMTIAQFIGFVLIWLCLFRLSRQ
ncbi:DMT family transporter [Paenibacillus contaminans]|uniref:EamA family transporter n=1 Tax=Paenibacillus contaminans TaxID=450362 RepID=A0A329MSQ3_9BACL|nr:DMT family transporter [Paenibacillus contaminans]RAV22318.1 EamA family transporter [Paenibacillus contaminans]